MEKLKLENEVHFQIEFSNENKGESLLGFHGEMISSDLNVIDKVLTQSCRVAFAPQHNCRNKRCCTAEPICRI